MQLAVVAIGLRIMFVFVRLSYVVKILYVTVEIFGHLLQCNCFLALWVCFRNWIEPCCVRRKSRLHTLVFQSKFEHCFESLLNEQCI